MYSTSIIILLALGFASGSILPICSQNEEFVTCGSLCAPTCEDISVKLCPEICVEGCFCKKGFIKKTKNGPCVPLAVCQTATQCAANEEFALCGTLCPQTCEDQGPRACPDICVETCVCKEGFIRSVAGGRCVRKDSCAKTMESSPLENACKVNEVYKDCGTVCPGTCTEPLKACEKSCAEGCFCQDGYVRHDESLECVKIEECVNTII